MRVPTCRGCAKVSASRWVPPTAPVWRRSWRTGTARRSTCGGPRSSWARRTGEIVRRTGKSKPCVWRWQARFAAEGVPGLLRDRTRPPRIPPLAQATIDRVVELTPTEPPHEATHWTASAMAAAVGISPSSVLRVWRAHKPRPHGVRTFKLSRDPAFAAKLRDIVGLSLDPPAHAVVLSVDETPQIQAPDRTQPGL